MAKVFGVTFSGGDPFRRPRPPGPFKVGNQRVSRREYARRWRIAFGAAWGDLDKQGAMPASRSARARKRALDARRPLRGCDHEFTYREDTIGDGLYTATERWLECEHCGETRPATYEDIPSDDYWY
jgi:hypothetical protein